MVVLFSAVGISVNAAQLIAVSKNNSALTNNAQLNVDKINLKNLLEFNEIKINISGNGLYELFDIYKKTKADLAEYSKHYPALIAALRQLESGEIKKGSNI